MIDLRFHPASDKNRLGYYSVGSYCTYSKVDAIEVGMAMNLDPHWHFNDEIFDSQIWTQEPTESLWQLYTQRALQLREKYDYIVLMYSGGADSHNVLNVFARGGIHLDEIVQFSNLEISGDKDNFWNAEIFRVAVPVTQDILSRFRMRTRHRVVDVSNDLANLPRILPDLSHWIYGKSGHLSINSRAFLNLRHSNRDYQQIMHSGKKMCFIWGHDKPPITNLVSPSNPHKTYHAIMFRDMVDCVFNPLDQINNTTWIHDELFYWSPESAKMLIKQGHTVKKFLSQVDTTHAWVSPEPTIHGRVTVNSQHFYLTNDGLNQLVYPCWDPKTFSVGKPSSQIIGQRDKWMLQHESDIKTKMFSALKEIQHRVKHLWVDWKVGMESFYSPCYMLEPTPEDVVVLHHKEKKVVDVSRIRPRIPK